MGNCLSCCGSDEQHQTAINPPLQSFRPFELIDLPPRPPPPPQAPAPVAPAGPAGPAGRATPPPPYQSLPPPYELRDSSMAVALSSRRAADEEAKAEVEVLLSRVEKSKQLGKKLEASLNRLNSGGLSLQETIGPIHKNVNKLQNLSKNLELVVVAIDRVKQPSDIRRNEEDIIRAGPDKIGLSEFLASMGRVTTALGELKSTNLRSNQKAISDLNEILKDGNTKLESLFRQILQEDARAVEPLHYITKEKPFPLLPSDKITRLGLINAYISKTRPSPQQSDSPTAQAYAKVRGPYLTNTLQNLAAASISTARKKSPEAVYRKGTNGIGMYASGIEGLFISEYENICELFSREEWGRVLSLTCQGALSELSKTLRELNTHIKDNIITDCFLGFEIVEIMFNLSFRLDNRTGELKGTFASATKPVRDTGKASLAELIEDVRRRIGALQILPNDGAAIPITQEVITRLIVLLEFLTPVTSIMRSLGDGNWMSMSASNVSSDTLQIFAGFDVGADGDKLFAHYCTDTIETLLSSVEQKGRSLLKGTPLIGTFLANNVAVVDRMIRTSELSPIIASRPPSIETWRKKALSLYMETWKDIGHTLLDSQPTTRGTRPPSGSAAGIDSAAFLKGLSSKEKDAIKDKFRNFNVAFDDGVAKHKSLVMEKEVREMFGKQVQMLIEPLYVRFFDRYHEIDKGKGKYVKYSKAEMASVLVGMV